MCHGQIISFSQGPVVCQELFLTGLQYSAVNGMVLLWKYKGLLCSASTTHIFLYHRYPTVADSAGNVVQTGLLIQQSKPSSHPFSFSGPIDGFHVTQ